MARYTITDLMDDDGTWTADSVADLSTGLRARCSAETKDIEARSAMSGRAGGCVRRGEDGQVRRECPP